MINRAPSLASSDSASRGFSPTPTASNWSICSSISADGGLYQTDKQFLRLTWRVWDRLVDAGLHESARRIERRGRGGVIDDPQLTPLGLPLPGLHQDFCHERLANAFATARRLDPKRYEMDTARLLFPVAAHHAHEPLSIVGHDAHTAVPHLGVLGNRPPVRRWERGFLIEEAAKFTRRVSQRSQPKLTQLVALVSSQSASLHSRRPA